MFASPAPRRPRVSTQMVAPPIWRVWLLAARPPTLPAAVAPVLVGTAVATIDGPFSHEVGLFFRAHPVFPAV